MNISLSEKKANVSIEEFSSVSVRQREKFKRFDNALQDNPAFALSLIKREEEKNGNNFYEGVSLSCVLKLFDYSLEINGKTCVVEENGNIVVTFVKSLRYPLKFVDDKFVSDWLNEAKSFAFILSNKRRKAIIGVRIVVLHTETLERKQFDFAFSYVELESFFKNAFANFSPFFELKLKHVQKRNENNECAKFPFEKIRIGQKDISNEVYSAIKNKNNAIIYAPTGIGKTVSTIYPALKGQSLGLCDKIFYLTAKTSGNKSVISLIDAFEKSGFDLNVLVISAKSKICNKPSCSPKDCPNDVNHSNRILQAVLEIAENYKTYDTEVITEFSRKYNVCPFMLETELVWFADLIVCDYNYIFNPAVSNKMSAHFSGNDVFLIDEAHNLVDRLRNIYSSEINISKLEDVSKKNEVSHKLKTSITDFIKFVKGDVEDMGFSCECLSSQSIDGLEREVNSLYSAFQEYFEDKKDLGVDIVNLLDNLKKFVDLITLRSDDYITFYNDLGNPELFMVNTGAHISEVGEKLGSLVMFSATLFPEEYYKYMLGFKKKDVYASFDSPFNKDNFLVMSFNLSTKYSDRETTVEDVVRAVYSAARVKTGNYIAFFPSYKYMMLAVNAFSNLFPDEQVIFQKSSMNEAERNEFISKFTASPQKTLFAFAVLGGAFSEGIDLVGEKLSGAAVIGLGSLPPSRKGSIVSAYYNDRFFDGEKFAYHYPGLNKVFQAGGRVIRSESDRGFLLIIDDRFLTEENIELLPDSWTNLKRVKNNDEIASSISDFWSKY